MNNRYNRSETPQIQARRGQIVIFILSVLLIFALLNNGYHYIDMNTEAIRRLIIAACALLGLLALGSILTFWRLTKTSRK